MSRRLLKTTACLLALLLTAGLCSCTAPGGNGGGPGGKTYVWEKEGFGGDFTITLNPDGTFEYYEGYLSSYMGSGAWKLKNGVVTLLDNAGYNRVFRFAFREGALVFLKGGSDDFLHAKVEDGDRFLPREEGNAPSGEGKEETGNATYTQISQDEARERLALEDGHILLDVRREEEYAEGHIPGAVCLPNESIGTERPEMLKDLSQVILIYCRSGRRSKEAAQKLADLGYENVYEFGGILDWTGEIVKDDTEGEDEPMDGEAKLKIEAGGKVFLADFEENSSASAFREKLGDGPIRVEMQDYGNFEKVGPLPWDLPRNDTKIKTVPGDVILYLGNRITIYYDENTWEFTRLARIDGVTREELLEALGSGDVAVTFSLAWEEG